MRQRLAAPLAVGADASTGAYDDATGAPSGEGVYLLAFFRNGRHAFYHHAGHYLGWAASISERIQAHVSGRGARIVQVVIAAGYDVRLVRTWQGTREMERALKGWHGSVKLCPLCSWNLAATGIGGDELLAPASPIRDLWTPDAGEGAAASARHIAAAPVEYRAPERVLRCHICSATYTGRAVLAAPWRAAFLAARGCGACLPDTGEGRE